MKTILILEDDLIVQKAYQRFFGKDYNLIIVATIAEAVAALNAAWPNLFISDMRVPDGSGAEAVAFCQARYPTLPIIVVSGTLDDAVGLKVYAKFEKPFSPNELLATIEKAI